MICKALILRLFLAALLVLGQEDEQYGRDGEHNHEQYRSISDLVNLLQGYNVPDNEEADDDATYESGSQVDTGRGEGYLYMPKFLGGANLVQGSNKLLSQAIKVINGFGLEIQMPKFLSPIPIPGSKLTVDTNVNTELLKVVTPAKVEQQVINGVEPCKNGAGVCMAAKDCYNQKGNNIGQCSNCVGCNVCCKLEHPCQARTDAYISYFTSHGPTYGAKTCSLNLRIRKEVCQVRLDFLDFEMAAPDEMTCACKPGDNMEIVNPRQQYGMIGSDNSLLCGANKDSHMYLDVNPSSMVILKATTSGVQPVPGGPISPVSYTTRWNVKVTQIPCEELRATAVVDKYGVTTTTVDWTSPIPSYYLRKRAPEGCLQYYTKDKGTIQNFSFKSKLPVNMDYSICFQNKVNTCGLTLRAITFNLEASPTACEDGTANAEAAELCCDASGNYIGVPPVEGQGYRQLFCGTGLGDDEDTIVSKTKGPLIMYVKSSDTCVTNKGGFRLMYDINSGTC